MSIMDKFVVKRARCDIDALVEQPAKIPASVSATISTDLVAPSGLGASQVLSESFAVLKKLSMC